MKKRFILAVSATILMGQIQLKAQCPELANVFVDACNGTGSEGDNEFIVMHNGNQSLDPTTLDIYYTATLGTNGTPSGNATSNTFHFGGAGFNNTYSTAELAFIDNLNATNSCTPAAQIFARPVSAAAPYTIPANAFFVVLQLSQTTAYNWTSFCGQARNQPIYIVFEHNNNGNGSGTTYGNGFNPGGSGRFKNNSGSSTNTPRYFSVESSTYPGCSETNSIRTYIPSALPNFAGSANGGTVGWSSTASPIYSNNGCAASIALPIHLMSFKGTVQEDGVKLSWDAACESSMQEHVVEKSDDGQFYPLAAIQAKNEGCGRTTTYTYTDHSFTNGYQLYRLKMTELSGKVTYSSTLSFKGSDMGKGNVWLLENPVKDQLQVMGMETGATYRIADLTGRTLISGVASGGKEVISTASLTNGLYLVNTGMTTLKFVKQQ